MSAYSDLILAESDLQSYWQVEEASGDIADSKGAITGTTLGNNTYSQTGLIFEGGNSILIDPGSDAGACGFSMGNVYGFLGLAPFTAEAWIKPGILDASNRIITSKEDATGLQWGWYLAYSSSAVIVRRRSPTVHNQLAFNTTLVVGSTYYVAATFDGSDVRVYLDGSLLGSSQASTASLLTHTAPFRIGSHSQGGNRLRGTIDEVAIYDATLAPASILEHYEVGAGLVAPPADTETTLAWLGT